MRLFAVVAFLFCVSGAAMAADQPDLIGTPAVLPNGLIMIEGKDVALWGIDALANDQECWHDNRAWSCGEEALTVLRHYLTGASAHCVVKGDLAGNKISAQCFRQKAGKENDIARYLVSQGWARDKEDDSDGLYAPDEEDARKKRRGIWTSKFQSVEDWKNGVPKYVEYKMAPPKGPSPVSTSGDSKNKPQ